jgi:hypothetical protein
MIATGFGKPSTRFKDQATAERVKRFYADQEKDPQHLQPVVAVDHLIALLGSGGTIPRGRYRRVVVTGEGDGGKIAVEMLLKADPGIQILWVGPKAKSRAEWANGVPERYRPLQNELNFGGEGGRVTVTDQYLLAIGEPGAGHGPSVTVGSKDGQATGTEASDLVVNAIGYDSPLLNMIGAKDGAAEVTLRDVYGRTRRFPNEDVIIGRQVVVNGQPVPIWTVGPAAGPTIYVKGQATMNVHNLGPSTEALMLQIFAGQDG